MEKEKGIRNICKYSNADETRKDEFTNINLKVCCRNGLRSKIQGGEELKIGT
jgi:hypothetical protein